jgi:SseB protein N-terminal domain
MTMPAHDGLPVLVIAPARPRPTAGGADILFEMRQQPDGRFVLPVFSSVRRLVEQLGRYQPWACLPLDEVLAKTSRSPAVRVVLDPVIDPGAWRWQQSGLEELAERARRVNTEAW